MNSKLEDQAKKLTTAQLVAELDWQQALIDHSCEIGDVRLNNSAGEKLDAIKAELRSRGSYVH